MAKLYINVTKPLARQLNKTLDKYIYRSIPVELAKTVNKFTKTKTTQHIKPLRKHRFKARFVKLHKTKSRCSL